YVLGNALATGVFLYRYGFSKDFVIKSSEYTHAAFFGLLPVVRPEDLPDTPDKMDIPSALQFASENRWFLVGSIIGLIFGLPLPFFGAISVVRHSTRACLFGGLSRLILAQPAHRQPGATHSFWQRHHWRAGR